MKRLIVWLILLVVAIFVGLQIKTNPGYVLISVHHLSIEMRLWTAIVALFIMFSVLYFIVRIFKYTGSVPKRWHRWRQHEKADKATETTNKGLLALAEGNWPLAEKQLMKHIENAPAVLVNYLAAAIAAQRAGQLEKRDAYLQKAKLLMPKAAFAIGLVQAQLQYDAAQYELALATLHTISELQPRHPRVLALFAKVYKKLNDWAKVAEMLALVQQYHALPEVQIATMAALAYRHLFCATTSAIELKTLWKNAPQQIRALPEMIFLYVHALNRLGETELAEKLARHTLNREWQSALVRFYGQIAENPKKQLAHAEKWLPYHDKDANLLFTLGQLTQKTQLWGKAKNYYADSLEVNPDPEVFAAYAALLEQLGDVKESLVYYRRGLKASFLVAPLINPITSNAQL
jgi:HemY protein